MRIWCRVLLMVITLSFVACNRKKEPSGPAGLEGASCLQVDSTSRYSATIEGDSIVVTYYANDMVDTTSLYSTEVIAEELGVESKVNYTEQEAKTLEQVIIPIEVNMPVETPIVAKADKPDTICHRTECEGDSVKRVDSEESVDVVDTMDVVCVVVEIDTLVVSDSIVVDSISIADTISVTDSIVVTDVAVTDTISLIDTIATKVLADSVDLVGEQMIVEDSVDESYVVRRGMIHRDATQSLFVPKGQWMLGGQVGWNQWNNENISYLLLENLSFKCHSFVVSPYLGYSFANNLMVGYRFSYKRGYLNVDEVSLGVGDGLSFSLTDFYSVYHSYKNSLFLRSYLPIGDSKIFGFLGELQLNYSFTEGKSTMGRDDLLRGVYQNTHAIGVGLGGGLSVFLADFVAAEVMLNVGGCDYKWGYQNIKEIDKKDEGRLNRSSADFKIDLFSIKFGLTFYL